MTVEEELRGRRDAAVRLLRELEDELDAIAESTAQSPDDEHDPEGSTVGFERARVASLLERSRRSLLEIDQALERRRMGRYGFCEDCGTPIAPERLEALPTTSQCVTCAGVRR